LLGWVYSRLFLEEMTIITVQPTIRWLPGEIGNLRRRAKKLLRIAMAVETPAHAERLFVPHYGHLVDLTVTAHATHSATDMHAVVKIDVVWCLVDPDPGDGLTTGPARPNDL